MKKKSSLTYWNPGKKLTPYLFSNESSVEKSKKEPEQPGSNQSTAQLIHRSTPQNPNKITYATSNRPIPDPRRTAKGFRQHESKPDDPKPQQQPETSQQAGLV
jgi:hypothetical protein